MPEVGNSVQKTRLVAFPYCPQHRGSYSCSLFRTGAVDRQCSPPGSDFVVHYVPNIFFVRHGFALEISS